MATIVSWNGTSYSVPATGEQNWSGAAKVDGLLISLATNGFQKTGGAFTLSSDVNFGGTAGLVALYVTSHSSTPATSGVLRLAVADTIGFRNNANGGNLLLAIDGSDNLTFNGNIVATTSAGILLTTKGGTGLASYTAGDLVYYASGTAFTKLAIGTASKVLTSSGTAPAWNFIVNANVDAAAAIAYSKLNLSTSILNADINASAAIAYSKLNLSTSIVNADVSASAAIAYSKLATLTSGNILVGSVGNVATSVAMSGDATIVASGAIALAATQVNVTSLSNAAGVAVHGVTTNSSASAGFVGEYIASVISSPATIAASNTFQDLTSISLTAGDWDVSFTCGFALAGATSTGVQMGISITSGNSSTGLVEGDNYLYGLPPTAAIDTSLTIAGHRRLLSGTTTVYAKIYALFSAGNPVVVGRLSARRIR